MNAYLWHVGHEEVRHHLRAESLEQAREQIAAIRGDEIARRAVIKPLPTPRADRSDSAAA